MPIQQLRDLTHKAFNKHKASTKGVCKNPLILDCTTQNSKQAPEGTQHCHNARPFYKKTLANRGHNRRAIATDPGSRPPTGRSHGKGYPQPASTTVCPTAVNHILLHTFHTGAKWRVHNDSWTHPLLSYRSC
ncbi:ATP-dependent protease ATPase subunit HslU [Labeo rohita]|uniref:ATP-dependent protease ATPase subunit HslU n=1 Tax=Labeo rohita TaxID=84645 RepID=A0ABQ8MDS3_LABRO|nr:ATP-dependent protease ATPase subunit HslU [Labeo rohita]